MTGKLLSILLLVFALLFGGVMYYLQVYGYYERLEPQIGYQVATPDGGTARLDIADFQGIDSYSSPLRYRACFTVLTDPLPPAVPVAEATPLNAPGWFDCFDAAALGDDLAAGRARALLAERNAPYGFDRVIALYDDGRARVWPQINACGEARSEGAPLPADCPPPPAR